MNELSHKKLTKIVGLKFSEFEEFIKSGEIHVRKARLIPITKVGDELAIASVILATIKLITEFKRLIFSETKLMQGGTLYVYTEATFANFENKRVDGLMLIVKSGVIRDAAILEMKNDNDALDKQQIEGYLNIAKILKIPTLITISNQFVADSCQSPINVKASRSVDMFHFSWSYLLTLAHILLFKNDTNIDDGDRIAIMKEVVDYLEHEKSGVCGFNQMQGSWKELVGQVVSGAHLGVKDHLVIEGATSWLQEECDMSLILSRHLGVLVSTSSRKGGKEGKIEAHVRSLVGSHLFESKLKIKNAVSDLTVTALLDKRTIELAVSLDAPAGKTLKGQVGWLKKQIRNCRAKVKDDDKFNALQKELYIEVRIKNSSNKERLPVEQIDKIIDRLKGRVVSKFVLIFIKDFASKFSSPKKIVEILEARILLFYSSVVEHLTKWEPSAPKMKQLNSVHQKEIDSESIKETGTRGLVIPSE